MFLKRALVAASIVAIISSATVATAATVMSKYNAEQTSYASQSLTLPLSVNWEFVAAKSDSNPAAPIISDGVAYIACGDKLYAVNTETGTYKWSYPADSGLGGTIKATPLLHENSIYFGATDGKLYCLDVTDGTFKWVYQTRGSVNCSPIIVDDVLYFGTNDNSVHAIDPETGDDVWAKPFTARDDFSGAIAASQGIIAAACMDGHLYGINSASGRGARWIFRLPMAPIHSSPVISDGLVIMAVHNSMYGISLRSGQLKWAVTLPFEVASTPAVTSDTIYVACKDRKVYAYSRDKRIPYFKWTVPAKTSSLVTSAPVITDNALYVTSTKGMIDVFSPEDGSLLWRYAISPSAITTPGAKYCDAYSSPVIAEDSLFVLTDDGVLHNFKSDAPDNDPPSSYNETPISDSYHSGAPPLKFSAILFDPGSGVDFSTVTMLLNGQPLEYEIDYLTSTVTYSANRTSVGKISSLDNGRYKISITAQDYKGNKLQKEWYFNVDKRLVPPKTTVVEQGVTTNDSNTGAGSGEGITNRRSSRGSRGSSGQEGLPNTQNQSGSSTGDGNNAGGNNDFTPAPDFGDSGDVGGEMPPPPPPGFDGDMPAPPGE